MAVDPHAFSAKGIESTFLNGNEKGVSVVTARNTGILGGCTRHDAQHLRTVNVAKLDENTRHVCANGAYRAPEAKLRREPSRSQKTVGPSEALTKRCISRGRCRSNATRL